MESEEIQNVLVENIIKDEPNNENNEEEQEENLEIKQVENDAEDENDDVKEEEDYNTVLVQKVEEQNIEKEEEEKNKEEEEDEIALNEKNENENEGENKIEEQEIVEKKDDEQLEKEEEEEEVEVEVEEEQEEKDENENEKENENLELAIKCSNEDDQNENVNENNVEEPQNQEEVHLEKKLIEEKENNDVINKLNFGSNQVDILYSKDEDDYNITFKQKSPSKKLILHWGIYNNSPITEWHHPNKENYPLKTKEFDSFALETEFIEEGEESKIEFKLPKNNAQGMGISFVFYDPINDIWYNNDNKDYQVEYF